MTTQHAYRFGMSCMTADALFLGDERGDTQSMDPKVDVELRALLKEKGHGAEPLSIEWVHHNAFESERVQLEGEWYTRVADATIKYAGDVVVHVEYLCFD